MHPRRTTALLLLAIPLLALAHPSQAGPLAGGAQPAPGASSLARPAPATSNTGAGVLTPPPGSPRAVPAARPLTAEERALVTIRMEAQTRVQALMKRAAGLSDPAAHRPIHEQVLEVKKQFHVRFLETKIAHARTRGDAVAAQELETALDRFMRPVVRSLPADPGATTKRGAR